MSTHNELGLAMMAALGFDLTHGRLDVTRPSRFATPGGAVVGSVSVLTGRFSLSGPPHRTPAQVRGVGGSVVVERRGRARRREVGSAVGPAGVPRSARGVVTRVRESAGDGLHGGCGTTTAGVGVTPRP